MSNPTASDMTARMTPAQRWARNRAFAAKRALEFIRAHPGGVEQSDLWPAGISRRVVEYLVKLRAVAATQIREPDRGPRCYRWHWTATNGIPTIEKDGGG